MSSPAFRAPRAARPPSPRPPRAQRALRVTGESLRPYPEKPPQFPGSNLEFIIWWVLAEKGWKIYGRPNIKGQTLDYAEADVEYQPAIPVAGLNQVKDFFRSDFLIIPGRRGPSPGPPYSRGIILDPRVPYTHPNPGLDRLRRGMLAQAGYLYIMIDGPALEQRPKQVVNAALSGADDSAVDRGAR